MHDFINSPEFQQLILRLITDRPEVLFFLVVLACGTLVASLAFFPRWFTITNEHHHHHYHPAPSAPQVTRPFEHLSAGYYYLDANGRTIPVAVQQPTTQQGKTSQFDDIFSQYLNVTTPLPPSPATQDALKPRNKRPKMSSSKRFRILRRDGFRCGLCGRGPDDAEGLTLHVDHKMPLAKGGTDDDDNLWALCNECNGAKSDTVMDELFEDSENPDPGGEK